jgi:hypothetical protein
MTKLVLSEGHVSPDSPISVQLIKNHHPGARPIVVITWPVRVTKSSPAKLGEVISNAARILGNASTELARLDAAQSGVDQPAWHDHEDLTGTSADHLLGVG